MDCCGDRSDGKKKTVAIVGGGYAGVNLAKNLDYLNGFSVYLIDRKNYFLHNIGALRAAVVPGFVNNVILPYNSLLKNGTFLQAEVTSIKGGSIQVAGQDSPIEFDYVVIATGASFGFPSKVIGIKANDARNEYIKSVEQLDSAGKTIVIVGGGPVGCELAGEIKAQHKDKDVTIVAKFDKLLSKDKPEDFVKRLEKCVEDIGIKIKRNVTVDLTGYTDQSVIKGPVTLPLSDGNSISADLVYICVGATKLNSACYSNGFTVDNNGRLKVNEFFQVEGHTNVFAIGDCIRMEEERLAYFAQMHAVLLAKNFQALHRGKSMKPYTPGGFSTILVSVGPTAGVSLMNGKTVGSFLTKMIKSKQLATNTYSGTLNVPLPVVSGKFESVSSKGKSDDGILQKLSAK